MFVHPTHQIVRHSDVEDAVCRARQNVDIAAVHAGSSTTWMAGTSPAMTTGDRNRRFRRFFQFTCQRASDAASHSRGAIASGSCIMRVSQKSEGAGNAGAKLAPIALRVDEKRHASFSHYRSSRFPRHSLRNGFNGLLRALPGVRDLIVTVACGHQSARLAPAQGCQDHTPSPSARPPSVRRQGCVHRIPIHVRDGRETPPRRIRTKQEHKDESDVSQGQEFASCRRSVANLRQGSCPPANPTSLQTDQTA